LQTASFLTYGLLTLLLGHSMVLMATLSGGRSFHSAVWVEVPPTLVLVVKEGMVDTVLVVVAVVLALQAVVVATAVLV
jgi:hypothetical protein